MSLYLPSAILSAWDKNIESDNKYRSHLRVMKRVQLGRSDEPKKAFNLLDFDTLFHSSPPASSSAFNLSYLYTLLYSSTGRHAWLGLLRLRPVRPTQDHRLQYLRRQMGRAPPGNFIGSAVPVFLLLGTEVPYARPAHWQDCLMVDCWCFRCKKADHKTLLCCWKEGMKFFTIRCGRPDKKRSS